MQYAFADFSVDPALRELRRGQNLVPLEPKGFDLLVYLITHRDRVISKDELVDQIWHGRFVSDAAVSSALRDLRRALGDDGKTQRFVKTVRGHGVRFVGDIQVIDASAESANADQSAMPNQRIRYCRSKDGTRIAFAVAGEGPPLIKTGHWLTHLEFDWESPLWSPMNRELLRNHQLIRYDMRGNGLSDWDVDDLTFERHVEDLEAVVAAAGVDRFAVFGVSQAAAWSVAYAARHPQRVSKLVLLGGYDRGWRLSKSDAETEAQNAVIILIEKQWTGSVPVAELFSATLMPDAPEDHWRWFSDLQRKTTTGQNAADLLRATADVDVRDDLAHVKAPTLFIHARNDRDVEFERGQNLAFGIPDAILVVLDTKNHVLHPTDPVWGQAIRHIREFLDD